MATEKKIKELRPRACGTRFGDVVEVGSARFLKIKCRRCTKALGHPTFHLFAIGDMADFSEKPD